MRRTLALLALVLLSAAVPHAQLRGVKATVTPLVSAAAAHPGDRVRLALTVSLPAEFHVQSNAPARPLADPDRAHRRAARGARGGRGRLPGPGRLQDGRRRAAAGGVSRTSSRSASRSPRQPRRGPGRSSCPAGCATRPATIASASRRRRCRCRGRSRSPPPARPFRRPRPTRCSRPSPSEPARGPAPRVAPRRPPRPRPARSTSRTLDGFTVAGTTGGYLRTAEFLSFVHDAERGVQQKGWFEGRGPLAILLLVLVGGIALNLTPCVLPMIPINLAIIGAGAAAASRTRGFLLGAAYGSAMAIVYGVARRARHPHRGHLRHAQRVAVVQPRHRGAVRRAGARDVRRVRDRLLALRERRQLRRPAGAPSSSPSPWAGSRPCSRARASRRWSSRSCSSRATCTRRARRSRSGCRSCWAWAWDFRGRLPARASRRCRNRACGWSASSRCSASSSSRPRSTTATRPTRSSRTASSSRPPSRPSVEEQLKAGWHASLAEGLAVARRERKPVLIDFWATWCKNCLTMDKTTLADAEVKAALDGYVRVKFQAEDPDGRTREERDGPLPRGRPADLRHPPAAGRRLGMAARRDSRVRSIVAGCPTSPARPRHDDSTRPASVSARRGVGRWLKPVVSLSLYGLIFWFTDVWTILGRIADARFEYVAAGVLLYGAGQAMSALAVAPADPAAEAGRRLPEAPVLLLHRDVLQPVPADDRRRRRGEGVAARPRDRGHGPGDGLGVHGAQPRAARPADHRDRGRLVGASGRGPGPAAARAEPAALRRIPAGERGAAQPARLRAGGPRDRGDAALAVPAARRVALRGDHAVRVGEARDPAGRSCSRWPSRAS